MNIETNRYVGTGSVTAGGRPVEPLKTTHGDGREPDPALTVRITPGGLFAQEIDAATKADLRRDDPLGQLIGGALNLPPPPMPDVMRG